MSFNPLGPLSELHAKAEAERRRERLVRPRSLAHDVQNLTMLLTRLARRLRRALRR